MPNLFNEIDNTEAWLHNTPRVVGFIRQVITGRNPLITTEQTVWPLGGVYTWPTTARTLTVQSSDPNDTAAGTGARSVIVHGLDINLEAIQETIELDGNTPSTPTTQEFFRVNFFVVATTGTYGGNNLGTLLCLQDVTALLVSTIQPNDGVSTQAVYTTPITHHGYINGVHLIASATKAGVDFNLTTRRFPTAVAAPFTPHLHLGRWSDIVGSVDFEYRYARYVPPGTDIEVLGEKNGTGSDPGCSVEIDLGLIPTVGRQF